MCALSISFDGAWRLMAGPQDLSAPQQAALMPDLIFSGPQDHPTTSWNDADIHAMIVAFYPDAIATLLGVEIGQLRDKSVPLKALPQSVLRDVFEQLKGAKDAVTAFADLQTRIAPLWHSARPDQHPFGRMITDWSRALMVNAAFSQTGRSVRQMQRRVKTLAGQPLKRLQRFSKAEQAFALALTERDADMAGIATDAGYSDQSHMGRHVRAQTGFTPAELMRRFESDEAFWSYRLMG
ncbi:helix-turn-helix domain-containing protein [Planktotalea sp.]|uniref:helix-turn-helix domain-containing protein n=1 Tax=Planktotalea sp. TaxID=2029877 RepID=UPI0025F6612C|nr:helix-turn-helix domain-containing protein [Planktotalea sp.]